MRWLLVQLFNPEMKHFPKRIITAIKFFQKSIPSFNKHLLLVHRALGCSHWPSRSHRRHTEDLGEEVTFLGPLKVQRRSVTEGE